jgi:hypothetical protein
MHVKIHGGTASGDASSLCYSCRYATIVRGSRLSEEVIECSRVSNDQRITFAVKFCNKYSDRAMPSLDHMEDIAWILRTDVKRKQVGFVRPSDLQIHVANRFRDD